MIVFYSAASMALLGVAALALIRLLLGPTVFDRAAALNAFGSKTVLMVALFGFSESRPEFYLDIAILYALLNFVGTVAVLKFFRQRSFDAGLLRAGRPHNTHSDR